MAMDRPAGVIGRVNEDLYPFRSGIPPEGQVHGQSNLASENYVTRKPLNSVEIKDVQSYLGRHRVSDLQNAFVARRREREDTGEATRDAVFVPSGSNRDKKLALSYFPAAQDKRTPAQRDFEERAKQRLEQKTAREQASASAAAERAWTNLPPGMRPCFEQYQTAYQAQMSRKPSYSMEPVPHERPDAEYDDDEDLEGLESAPEFDIAQHSYRGFVPEESAQHVREMRSAFLFNMVGQPPLSANYPPGWGPAFVPGVAPPETCRPCDQMRQISEGADAGHAYSHDTVPGEDRQPSGHAFMDHTVKRQGKFTNKVETSVRQPIPNAPPRGYYMGQGLVEAECSGGAEMEARFTGSNAYLSRASLAEGYQVRSSRSGYRV